ncbi:MAG TPA: S24 family peptidase [Roseiarcus sp.]|nr:S24 family peptidase [Roseiarcus sp.]
MKEPSAKNPIVARLDAACAASGLSRQGIATAAGLDRGFLQKLEQRGPQASVRVQSLIQLADAAGVPREELIALAPKPPPGAPAWGGAPDEAAAPALSSPEMTPDVPILGVAAGAALGAFVFSGPPIDYVARPPGLRHVADAYAIYVVNESMSPLHNPGDLRFVHPRKPPRAGESVIVQVRDGDEIQAYIKIYERRSDGWIVCRQTHPPAEVKFKTTQVVAMHRVMTINELFGA